MALDDHRHFVHAAEACFVTQPTLTLQIQKLEEELGIQLFDRQRKPLQPTPTGAAVIEKARILLRESRQLTALAKNALGSLEGEFRVGIIPTLSPYLLPLFLPSFTRQYPRTRLHLQEMQTADIVSALRRDTLDAGILSTPLGEPDIRETPLFNEPFQVLLPPQHPLLKHKTVNPTALSPEDALLLSDGHCFREQALRLCKHKQGDRERHFHFESGSLEALRQLVYQGMGYTLLPELAADPQRDGKGLRRFASPQPVREISLVSQVSFARMAFLSALRQSIQANLPDHFHKLSAVKKIKWR